MRSRSSLLVLYGYDLLLGRRGRVLSGRLSVILSRCLLLYAFRITFFLKLCQPFLPVHLSDRSDGAVNKTVAAGGLEYLLGGTPFAIIGQSLEELLILKLFLEFLDFLDFLLQLIYTLLQERWNVLNVFD